MHSLRLKSKLALCAFLLLSVAFVQASVPHPAPVALNYSVTDLGNGTFDYQFQLVLDNHSGDWQPGQSWGWLIFGDQFAAPSPLANFIGDNTDFPIGPWTTYVTSSGVHNGPTLGNVGQQWTPAFVGDAVTWSGTSTANLLPGQLLFSTLATGNAATSAALQVANLVPEPSATALLGLALLASFKSRRRRD